MSKKCFSQQIEPHTANISVCIEEFLHKLTKNLSFRTKKCFSNQIELYTATLSFSTVLKYFYRN